MSHDTKEHDKLLSLGDSFKHARQAAKLSIEDVAQKLHLTTSIITSIEDNSYGVLRHLVFIRGYIRSYAKLLNLPSDPLIAQFNALPDVQAYEQAEKEHALQNVIQAEQSASRLIPVGWLTTLFLLSAILLAGMWWHLQEKQLPQNMLLLPEKIVQKSIPSEALPQMNAESSQKPKKPADVAKGKSYSDKGEDDSFSLERS